MATTVNESEVEQSPTFGERVQQFLDEDRKKLGGMSPGAMGRLGLAELREAVSLDSGNEANTPYGMYGTLTPGEVAAGRREDQVEEELNMSGFDHKILDRENDRTPGDIGLGSSNDGRSDSTNQGRDGEQPSPGDIARDNSTHSPEQEMDRSVDRGRGR